MFRIQNLAMEGQESIAATSPKNRLKFISSYGGKILPRPGDGQLKYVGGDTRVFAFPRSVSFSEVMGKLTSAYADEVLVKYQLMPEDLDALITVKSDEDFRHMIDEYDRQERSGSHRFRLYLFPAKITDQFNNAGGVSHHKCRVSTLERRYIDAINNVHVNHREASSSPGSSPTSTTTGDSSSFSFSRPLHKVNSSPNFSLAGAMHKAHSSPNLQVMGKHAATPAPACNMPPFPRAHDYHYQQHARTHRLRQNPSAGPPRKVSSPSSPTGGYEMNPVNGPMPRHIGRYSKPLTSSECPNMARPSCFCHEVCHCCCLRRHL